MRHVSGARWITVATALVFIVASGLIIADYAMETSRAKQAVATPPTAAHLQAEGDRRFAAGDVTGALQLYDEALALDPTDYAAYYRAGVALSHLGDREQAVSLFLHVTRIGPPDDDHVQRARAWLQAAGAIPAGPPAARR